MKLSLAGGSLLLFSVSVLLLVLLTVFETAMTGLSLGAERIITLLLLVLPPAAGAVLGGMSLSRKEGKAGLGITGMILNTLFALFHLMIALFAG